MIVQMSVLDFLERAALVYKDRIGLVDEPDQVAEPWEDLTFAQMLERAKAQAAGLDKLGVPRGGRVAMVTQNSARLETAFFGVSGWGRVLVPVNFRLSTEEIRYIVDHSGAEVLIVDPEVADVTEDVECKHKFVIGADSDAELYPFDTEPEPWEPDENATATINYTSGTTARPKGVEMTHRSLWMNATTFGLHTQLSDRDVYLHTLPMFHCNGWGMSYITVGVGAKNVVLRKVNGAEILRRVEEHGVTIMCGAPAVVNMVLDAAKDWDGPVPGRDKVRIVVAGAPPPTRTIERVETELGWEFIQIYGLTETAPLVVMNRSRSEWDDLNSHDRASLLGRAGAPVLGMQVSISEHGEVRIRGNHVLKEYWQQPEASADALRDGWFHSGDGGFIDDANYLSISDRKKDVIITGGENVSSIEVEDAVFSHPDVAEVAVVGVPHDKWGETVKALVVLNEGSTATERDIIDHCRSKIAHYKCPTSVDFRDALTRTATGKLQKFKLREPFWEGRERRVN